MTLLQTVRTYLLVTFMALPILLIGFTGIFSLGMSNMGLFMLFLAQAIVMPTGIVILQFIMSLLPWISGWSSLPPNTSCQLLPNAPQTRMMIVAPSIWISQVVLFMTYMFYNAYSIYNMPVDSNADPAKVSNRQSRSFSVMIMAVVACGMLLALRFTVMKGCETLYGSILSIVLAGGFAIGWYEFASLCGATHSDIFGIVSGILPPGANDPPPTMCVYNEP
jgi:hypothetical protein